MESTYLDAYGHLADRPDDDTATIDACLVFRAVDARRELRRMMPDARFVQYRYDAPAHAPEGGVGAISRLVQRRLTRDECRNAAALRGVPFDECREHVRCAVLQWSPGVIPATPGGVTAVRNEFYRQAARKRPLIAAY